MTAAATEILYDKGSSIVNRTGKDDKMPLIKFAIYVVSWLDEKNHVTLFEIIIGWYYPKMIS